MVLGLLLTGAACAGDADGGAGSDATGLSRALAQVSDTAETRTRVEYGDFEAVREATNGLFFDKRYNAIAGFGATPLLRYASQRDGMDPAGFDPTQAQQAIYAGGDRGAGVLLGGFILADVETRLAGLHAKKESGDGGTTWSLTGANVGKGWNKKMTVLHTSDTGIGYAKSKRELALVTSEGEPTLADNASFQSIADCLGDDITAAVIFNPSKPMTGVVRYAAGVQARDPENVTEVFCVVTADEKVRNRVAEKARKDLGRQTKTKDIEVSGGGTLVKATGRPERADAQPGRYIAYAGGFTPPNMLYP
jgi:hypothetical protein